jgi:hypothetical protein
MTTVGISIAQANDTDWVTQSVSLVCAIDIPTVVKYVRLLIYPVCIISLCYRYIYRSHVCQVATVGISIAQTNDTDWVY